MEFSAATTLTTTDWRQWAGRNTAVSGGGIELAAEPLLTVDRLESSTIDIAVDADGVYYTLRSSAAVYRHDDQRSVEHRLWSAEGSDLAAPRAICVSDGRLSVVDETGTLAVISTRLQQPIGTIETDVSEPVTIAAAGGSLYLLDTASESVQALQTDSTTATVCDSLSRPLDMTVDERGSIYVLEAQATHKEVEKQAATGELLAGRILAGRQRRIRKLAPDGECDPGLFPLSEFETVDGEPVTPTRLGTAVDAPLLVTGQTELDDQTVVGDLDPETSTLRERTRLDGGCRVFRTPVANSDGTSYAVVGDANRCCRLVPTETYTRGAGDRYRGCAYRQFDAGSPIQWHRLTVDREAPTASTRLRLSYLASDDPSPLDEPLSSATGLGQSLLVDHGIDTVWELLSYEPAGLAALSDELTVGDAEKCLDTALDAAETALSGQWQTVESTSTDVLLSEATGQYLTVRLELLGTPTASPRVNSVRAFWPRQSSLQYLPELYRTDETSGTFLEQLLSVFDVLFSDIEREVESVTQYLDPAAVPAEGLPWLAEWIGVDTPTEWPIAATRELLAAGPELHSKRATRDGLREMLGIYLRHLSPPKTPPADWMVPSGSSGPSTADLSGVDHGLCILEPQDLDAIESTVHRDAYKTHLPTQRSVAVYAGPFDEPDHREAVEAIIREETPAHVQGSLVELEPAFTLGADSFLGSNTRLSERQLELGETPLGNTAVLD
ncbi:phage tail-like protein [Halohasta litchfieldiae]|uniref:Phage tail protein domain-containing protein n=1 Tax=Halohasta litchfieldiae TaxID=1073996 RepID=A0A1H6VF02_9EURY|nr:phage tail protein [Halohasta litchfieldiae]ATW88970.1 phage tail-like protein [Halohasta litchfieldiae]SEJ01554.1 phage tail protein domain-containing protein [Halohasta litchfieldiae]